MNWIPEMMKRAAKYGDDLDHPEVVAWAHEQWQKAANEWRYEVDGEHRFRTQAELAAYLHVGKMQLTKFISKGVEEFQLRGHMIRVNDDVFMAREQEAQIS